MHLATDPMPLAERDPIAADVVLLDLSTRVHRMRLKHIVQRVSSKSNHLPGIGTVMQIVLSFVGHSLERVTEKPYWRPSLSRLNTMP